MNQPSLNRIGILVDWIVELVSSFEVQLGGRAGEICLSSRQECAPRAAKILHVVVRARDDFHSCPLTRIASIYFYRSKSTHERYVAPPVCGIETRGMPRAYDSVLVSL